MINYYGSTGCTGDGDWSYGQGNGDGTGDGDSEQWSELDQQSAYNLCQLSQEVEVRVLGRS